MKNGVGSSKYKPVDYERLQAIIEAKRLETDALREKVIFLFSVSCCCYKKQICYALYSLLVIQHEIKKKQKYQPYLAAIKSTGPHRNLILM